MEVCNVALVERVFATETEGKVHHVDDLEYCEPTIEERETIHRVAHADLR